MISRQEFVLHLVAQLTTFFFENQVELSIIKTFFTDHHAFKQNRLRTKMAKRKQNIINTVNSKYLEIRISISVHVQSSHQNLAN